MDAEWGGDDGGGFRRRVRFFCKKNACCNVVEHSPLTTKQTRTSLFSFFGHFSYAGGERGKGEKDGDHEGDQEVAGAEGEPREEAEAGKGGLRQGGKPSPRPMNCSQPASHEVGVGVVATPVDHLPFWVEVVRVHVRS